MMYLNATAFNRLLNSVGQSFTWRRAHACPCVNRSSGQPNPTCQHCAGKGRLWIVGADGSAGVVSQAKLRNYAAFGAWDKDDMLLSIPSDSPLYAMGQFDRVLAKDRTEPFSVALVRGLNDKLHLPVVSLERCFWLNGAVITELPLPAVSDDGVVSWPNGGAPPAQASYSLSGRRHPEYFCYLEIPTDRPMHHGERLPRRVVLRRFDLLGRS